MGVVGRYVVSALLGAMATGVVYGWAATGALMAFVSFQVLPFLALVASGASILLFVALHALTKNARTASLTVAAALTLGSLAYVTVTEERLLDRDWWETFSLIGVFFAVPPVVAAAVTWWAAKPRSERRYP